MWERGNSMGWPRVGCARAVLPLGLWQVTWWEDGVAQHRARGTALRHRYPICMLNLTLWWSIGKQTNFLFSQEYPSECSMCWTMEHTEQVEFLLVDTMWHTHSHGKICSWWFSKWTNWNFFLRWGEQDKKGKIFCSWLVSLGEAVWKKVLPIQIETMNIWVDRQFRLTWGLQEQEFSFPVMGSYKSETALKSPWRGNGAREGWGVSEHTQKPQPKHSRELLGTKMWL